MNHKQKLGYMALGAGILALGITIGQIITPDIEAQNNGVFDQIQCNRLTVVNDSGEERISLSAPEKFAMLNFLDGDDIPISISHSDQHSRISLGDSYRNDLGASLTLSASDLGSSIDLKKGRYEMDWAAYSKSASLMMEDTATDQKFFVEFDNSNDRLKLVLVEDDVGVVLSGNKNKPGVSVSDGRHVIGRLPRR